MQRKIRVLVGKPGLDGHDRGAKVVAAALRDAGMEVIYTGLHQTPEQIVEAALQEDVDVVALSILSGAHMTLFPEVLKLMKGRGVGEDVLITGGGIIPPEDMETLARMGVGRLFGPGASTQQIAEYIRSWFVQRHGEDALAPAPAFVSSPAPARTKAPAARRNTGPRDRASGSREAPPRPRSRAAVARAQKTGPARRTARAQPSARAKTRARKRRPAAAR
jgi:methylmalonyl-CoA mutase C-terminal domain/subunit